MPGAISNGPLSLRALVRHWTEQQGSCLPSVHHPAAVDADGLAGNKRAAVRGEKGGEVADVLGRAAAFKRLLLQDAVIECLLIRVHALGGGRGGAGGGGLDGD